MAYVNLISSSCINPLETFQKFRNFLCKRVSSNGSYDYSTTGIGWTLIDSSYATNEYTVAANDWFVAYSQGEDGLRNLYVKVTLNSGSFAVVGYLYWNSSTHTGTQAYGGTNVWTNTAATNNVLWVYGDLDQWVGISKYSAAYYSARFGWMPDSTISQAITNYASAITAGSSVTLTFSSVPVEWAVNTKLFAWNNDNIERVNISNIAGNDVTFTSFANSYSSGANFSMERTDYVSQHATSPGIALLISHAGVKNDTVFPDLLYIDNPSSGDGLTGLYPIKKIYYSDALNWIGPMKDMYISISHTAETTHTVSSVSFRAFTLVTIKALLKEV